MFWCFKGVEPSESVLFRVLPMSSHLTGKRVIVTFPSYSEVMVKTILNFTWPDFILWYASNAFANGILLKQGTVEIALRVFNGIESMEDLDIFVTNEQFLGFRAGNLFQKSRLEPGINLGGGGAIAGSDAERDLQIGHSSNGCLLPPPKRKTTNRLQDTRQSIYQKIVFSNPIHSAFL